MTKRDIRVQYATGKTPVLAVLHMQIVQTLLLEMMKSEPPGDRPAARAFELVREACELVERSVRADD